MRNTAQRHRLRHLILCYFISFIFFPALATSLGLITTTHILTGDQTLVSAGDKFELGFFNSSNDWYIGIWYNNIEQRTIVWVANRDSPLRNSSGILKISADDGNLVLTDETGESFWSSNHSRAENTVAELLDTGNFVLRQENDESPENYLWQSFDYPTDTLLPGMKLGWDTKTGLNRYITSWKSEYDPSSGEFSFKLDTNGFPEIYLRKKQKILYRSGPWNGLRFSGVPEMKSSLFSFLFVNDPDEVFYSFYLNNQSVYSRLVVQHNGELHRRTWIPTTESWSSFWYAPKDLCDQYRECGAYGICDSNASPICKCMKGFLPNNPQAWSFRDGSAGCFRVNKLNCRDDGFLTYNSVKLPDSGTAFVDKEMSLDQCREMCLNNCSCRGYTNANISGIHTGCVIWAEDLYDMRLYAAAEGGQDFYFRVPASDLDRTVGVVGSRDKSDKTKQTIKITGITVSIGVLIIGLVIFFVWKRGKSKNAQGSIIDHRGRRPVDNDSSSSNKQDESCTMNEVTVTMLDGR
ncbi:hypothetical protein BUALT_Bualt03G0069200 [Buddleja alternifolia]|uniref:Uncharacterized protein n=1 Tax=Buddleja alternifolia TaxID=168488 RepID=A0AAV6XZ29_9LAMI|nr:hypothetical protein BUALT_Bualt03G0069200 [Buddleja alternifolia]